MLDTDVVTIEQRLRCLNAELDAGQEMLSRLVAEEENVRQTMQRIVKAIQALEEELAGAQAEPSSWSAQAKRLAQVTGRFNQQYLALQQEMLNENRIYSMLSNIMKNLHDTVRNVISNLR